MVTLTTPIQKLTRVGQATWRRLKKLGLENAKDLLFYFPFRYDDFSKIIPIGQLEAGVEATVKGRVDLIQNKRSFYQKKLLTEALVTDQTGSIRVVWFNQPFLSKVIKVGNKIFLSGKVDWAPYGVQLTSPSWELEKIWLKETIHTARLVPIYSLTGTLTQKQIRFLIRYVLALSSQIKDWLPREIKEDLKLLDLPLALSEIHFPGSRDLLERARFRLKFDELFLIQLQAQKTRKELKKQRAPEIIFKEKETKKFVASLPFRLTDAQRKAAWEILQDLAKPSPMNRLLEGDVGSGKTVVALIAILNVVSEGYQAVFMAPTEILARQHFETITKLLEGFKVNVGLLTHSASASSEKQDNSPDRIRSGLFACKKSDLLKKIGGGQIDLTIGTHALIQENVSFKNLALAIIDEQHRFGVEQRAALVARGTTRNFSLVPPNIPRSSAIKSVEKAKVNLQSQNYAESISSLHFLSMTATPIPRSLALTLYGDLDLSILDEMPPNRRKIITEIIDQENRPEAYDFIKKEVQAGRQIFVICPLIDPSDKLGVKAAREEYEKLKKEIFPNFKIGLLHGRMKNKEKEEMRSHFRDGKLDILVATSLVEVGVDIPNASVMMIEGTERFGLASLHQFRGRVGRASYQSYCFLFTESGGQKSRERLEALLTSSSGFELAEKDLKMRGPGEIYGTRQSGLPELKIASLSDWPIIKQAQEKAKKIAEKDPELLSWPLLKEKLEELERMVHLE